jgi:hypothetical protein
LSSPWLKASPYLNQMNESAVYSIFRLLVEVSPGPQRTRS